MVLKFHSKDGRFMKIIDYCTIKKEYRTIIVYYKNAPTLKEGFHSIKENYEPKCPDCNIDTCPLYERAPQYQ